MEHLITGPLATFNQLFNEMDEIYHLYAKKMEISDTALWLLYSLYDREDTVYTQRDFCAEWHRPPQTINSLLKKLERQGIIRLEPAPDNKKNKLIQLTEEGKELTKRLITPLIHAEERTLQGMSREELERFLSLLEKYVLLLRNELKE